MIFKEILENLRETTNSEIIAKDFEIQNLKSEMSQSEMKAKKELENPRETKNSKISANDLISRYKTSNLK